MTEYASRRAPVAAPWRTASSRASQKVYNEESAAPNRLFCLCVMTRATGEFAARAQINKWIALALAAPATI